MPVASAEAPILAMLLPSSSAPISRSRIADRLETTAASRLPCFDSRNMLARDALVSAVSLAAKNAETRRQPMTMENVSQSMCVIFTSSTSCQFGLQKIAYQRRLDVGSDHGATDRFKQDESEPAALDLLVLRHQRHQRVGVGEPLLGKSRDILQMGRQADLGKVAA